VAELPQASVAVQVFVTEYVHPLTNVSAPSTPVGVTGPQLSVAVALPKAALTVAADGLHPLIGVDAATVITGGVTSFV
jgi:hypothetical protein